jgi:hypothetical protein
MSAIERRAEPGSYVSPRTAFATESRCSFAPQLLDGVASRIEHNQEGYLRVGTQVEGR